MSYAPPYQMNRPYFLLIYYIRTFLYILRAFFRPFLPPVLSLFAGENHWCKIKRHHACAVILYTKEDLICIAWCFWFSNRLSDYFSKKYEKNFKPDQEEAKIATYFSTKKTPQTAYLCWMWGFYLFSTVKDGIIAFFFIPNNPNCKTIKTKNFRCYYSRPHP